MSLQTLNSVSWQSAYERYRQTPTWAEKRRLVFQRSHRLCEGCGVRPPREVHHLRYPVNCLPGSAEWIKCEKLFDLVALCEDCHSDLHA
jgi:5-methylcytosine-specific restriction endonuclease McrA